MTNRVCTGYRRFTSRACIGVIGGTGGAPGRGTMQKLCGHFPGGGAGAALDEVGPACGILDHWSPEIQIRGRVSNA
ncbi:MAG: hypothetical protein WBN30_12785 [Polyangiales bacterium]